MSKLKKILCGTGSESISPEKEVAESIKRGAFVLDVRTMMEAKRGIVPGATSIPLLRLKRHLDELPRNKTIVTYCGTGERAGKAKDILESAGFKVINGGAFTTILKIVESKKNTPKPASLSVNP
jgi:phage shock protein E